MRTAWWRPRSGLRRWCRELPGRSDRHVRTGTLWPFYFLGGRRAGIGTYKCKGDVDPSRSQKPIHPTPFWREHMRIRLGLAALQLCRGHVLVIRTRAIRIRRGPCIASCAVRWRTELVRLLKDYGFLGIGRSRRRIAAGLGSRVGCQLMAVEQVLLLSAQLTWSEECVQNTGCGGVAVGAVHRSVFSSLDCQQAMTRIDGG